MVTGGAGFIGSALVRQLIAESTASVVNVDKLTYAGNLQSLGQTYDSPRHHFLKLDICDREGLQTAFRVHSPDAVMHLAAESHVDRSIEAPLSFLQTSILGTFHLLEAALEHWRALPADRAKRFRLLHVSTDEVYGDLAGSDALFTETTSYSPSSPYAATKASSDHLARAWHRTFGLPVVVTNCSNNYGPNQFPEKLIPHVILNALAGKPLPVYGDGRQVRDWLYVDDHARALRSVLERGRVGETYNIGGHNQQRNLDVVKAICVLLGELAPGKPGTTRFESLITLVRDRPGHDSRYAIDASRMSNELNWKPTETFETGLRRTVQWYLENEIWWRRVLDGSYRLERLGVVRIP